MSPSNTDAPVLKNIITNNSINTLNHYDVRKVTASKNFPDLS